MDLLTSDVIVLMCSSKVKDVSNIRPKFFCEETCWIGLLLKKIVDVNKDVSINVKKMCHLENFGVWLTIFCQIVYID